MTVVELCVLMDCAGCESKVRKALVNLRGIHDVDIDMATQKVTVTGSMDQKKVLKAVRKTGCRATLWPHQMNSSDYSYIIKPEYYNYQLQHTMPAYHMILNAEPRSYNYYEHGYDDSSLHDHPHAEPGGNMEKARALLSDENPTSCSVM